jgi:hypothetical protein
MNLSVPAWDRPKHDRPNLLPWVRFPSARIADGLLTTLTWSDGGADAIAALMAFIVIAHHAHQESGSARLTWTQLSDATSLSRAKLGAGLFILSEFFLIERGTEGRSTFRLSDFNPQQGWAMLPARGLYGPSGSVTAFRDFTLRGKAELDALKVYLVLAARRTRNINATLLSYDKIHLYAGVHPTHIRRALSVLAATNLVHISTMPSEINQFGIANMYRLAHLEPRQHPGTVGRLSM